MHYKLLPEPDAVAWFDDAGNGGVVREGTAEWDAYQAWLADGGVPESFDPPYLPSRDDAMALAHERLARAVDDILGPIQSHYAEAEIATWPIQLAEATAWLADPLAPTPILDGLLGEDDKADLCQRIVDNGGAYAQTSGRVFAWRRACTAWIQSAGDVNALTRWQPHYPEVPA